MTRSRLSVLLVLPLLVLAGCGSKKEPSAGAPAPPAQHFTVVLDYFPNADHAPIYEALHNGEFRRAGLDVKLITPSDPSAPLKILEAGRADLAITYEPELLLARDRGLKMVSVGALVQKPLTTLMAVRGSGVRGVRDLRGKTVGTAGIPYQSAYLRTILAHAGVPARTVKQVDVGFNLVPAMLSKRVAATLGAFWNYEGVDLQRRGKHPTILRMERLGVPTYNELIFAARRTSLHPNEAAKIRRFLQAVARGAAEVRRNPNGAADALVAANPDLDKGLQLASIRATAPTFLPASRSKPFGWQDQNAWHVYGRWMLRNHLLHHDPLAENALTNEFLPGQGLASNTDQP